VALANVLFRGVDGAVDLVVVLMVGLASGEVRYLVNPLVSLLRMLLGVGFRLLLQVVEVTHAFLLCGRRVGLPSGRTYPLAGHHAFGPPEIMKPGAEAAGAAGSPCTWDLGHRGSGRPGQR
jgi:hypothetical protein